MRKGSKARIANGAVSAAIVVFFLVHALLGSISGIAGVRGALAGLVWAGVVLVGVHVACSVVTSRGQLADPQRPASRRKKRHLALKWATGLLLAALAAVHVATMRAYGAEALQSSAAGAVLAIALSAALAAHLCVGSKSLLKDLGVDRRYQAAFRVAVCAFAVLFAVCAVLAVVL